MKDHRRFCGFIPLGLAVAILAGGCTYKESQVNTEGDTSPGTVTAGSKTQTTTQPETVISLEDGSAAIEKSGTYRVTGTLTEGNLTVDVDKETDDETVYLIFSNVDIASTTTAPIHIKEAKQVVIILEEGTNNTVTQGSEAAGEESDGITAAIYSKADLAIEGEGSLTVHTEFNDGITSKDDLTITGGTITVDAAGDGIVGKDLLFVDGAQLEIKAGKDGLRSTNADEEDKGNIVINSGTFQIVAASDGVEAAGDVTISGGDWQIEAGDDGVHADGHLTLEHGDIIVSKSYEGLEGSDITINSGSIRLISEDDGINVNSEEGTLTINGGEISVQSGGDGLDSNGNIVQNGGTVVIDTTTVGSMDTPIDYDGTFTGTGGTITDQDGTAISTEQSQRGGRGQRPMDGNVKAGREDTIGRGRPEAPAETKGGTVNGN